MAVCRFSDDGTLVEGYGLLTPQQIALLSHISHRYRRALQGHADQTALFSGMRGWTPPRGFVLRGSRQSLCAIANVVCWIDNADASLNEVLTELQDIARW